MLFSTIRWAAASVLCQSLLFQNADALRKKKDPTGTHSGANDAVWPPDHILNVITDRQTTEDPLFPFGHAPAGQRPCHIEVWLNKTTWEDIFVRRSVRFKVPRSDILDHMVPEAATVAWFYDLKTMQYNPKSRCGSESRNFQLWEDVSRKEWVIDFNEVHRKEGDARAQCAIDRFYDNWGMWTGCDYQQWKQRITPNPEHG